MKSTDSYILTINAGSSSTKFASYQAGEPLKRGLYGTVDRIGANGTNLTFQFPAGNRNDSRSLTAADHRSAVTSLVNWREERHGFASVRAVGHRVVHGMRHIAPELVTQELLDELHRIGPYDPHYLRCKNELIETFRQCQLKLPHHAVRCHLRGTGPPRHRIEGVEQFPDCGSYFHGCEPGHGPRHSNR